MIDLRNQSLEQNKQTENPGATMPSRFSCRVTSTLIVLCRTQPAIVPFCMTFMCTEDPKTDRYCVGVLSHHTTNSSTNSDNSALQLVLGTTVTSATTRACTSVSTFAGGFFYVCRSSRLPIERVGRKR